MRWLLIVGSVVAALIAIVVIGGMMLPQSHVATRSVSLDAAPDVVWATITDVAAFPSWRPGVTATEVLPQRDGHFAWLETSGSDAITFERVESDPPRRMVSRIAPGLPFGGDWIFELTPDDRGTRLTITERGEVYNPVFRFMSRFIFGHTKTMDDYLRALGKKHGQEVTPASA